MDPRRPAPAALLRHRIRANPLHNRSMLALGIDRDLPPLGQNGQVLVSRTE